MLVAGSVLEIPSSDQVEAGREEVELVSDDELLQGHLNNSETLKKLGTLVAHLDVDKGNEVIKLIHSYLSSFRTPHPEHT